MTTPSAADRLLVAGAGAVSRIGARRAAQAVARPRAASSRQRLVSRGPRKGRALFFHGPELIAGEKTHPTYTQRRPKILDTANVKSSSTRRNKLSIGLSVLFILGLVGLAIVLFQGRLIYYPYRYAPQVWQQLPLNFEPLRYRTSQGAQVSFYRRPASGGEPLRIWLMCNGQGNYALEWADLLPQVGDRDAGFILLDYPGYGFCEGSCTPGRILAASEGAVEALRLKLGLPAAQFAARLGVFGYSLGTAPALHYAAKHPVRRVVVAAPFTSLVDMGNAMYFWPCGQLLWQRFDNRARLAEIARQNPRPSVLIVHGDHDEDIPVTMSGELAAPYPGWVELNVVAGADHGTVLIAALRMLGKP